MGVNREGILNSYGKKQTNTSSAARSLSDSRVSWFVCQAFSLCRAIDPVKGRQGITTPAEGNKMVSIGVQRTSPPTPGYSLIGLEPFQSSSKWRVRWVKAKLPEHETDQPCHVTIAGKAFGL
jgi:hypothetical protein